MQITKSLKRSAPPPKSLEQFIVQLQNVEESELINVIQSLGNWVWPKTDLFHWIAVLNRVDAILERIVKKYELPYQSMPLEEFDKKLVLGTLHLTKTLWDNATNRNLYNSYEHLHNLLTIVELDIVYEILRFLVKPAQRIPSQRSLRASFTNGQSKYQVLAGRWNVGLDVNEILSSKAIQVEMINYQYYRTAQEFEKDLDKIEVEGPFQEDTNSNLKQESLVSVPLQPTEPNNQNIFEYFQRVKTDYKISGERGFELICKIRLASYLSDPGKRKMLYCIRMLALAVLSNLYSEEVATSKIFLFESDLIAQVAHNLSNNTDLGQDARFCCLTLLDNLAHYRGKLNEVLSVMNVSANHGFLMVELNNVIEGTATDALNEFVEGLFSFLTFILGTQVGGNMIISAGIIPLLISSFNNSSETHLKIIAKCCNMLDNILYGFPPALNVFTGANGLQALVSRIQLEIEICLKIKANFTNAELSYTAIDPGASSKYRELLARMPLLRAIMKLVLHMMQSSGTADGMRNLIDTSLPKSLLIIFENSQLFGSIGVFGLAVNIMSTFIHNEPTSLAILQESHVTTAFLQAANEDLPVSAEVISAFPNAFGAICLNPAGLQSFTTSNPMDNFLSVLTKEDHLKTLLDNDVPHLVGNSIDEFIRHHPTTKDMVMAAIIKMLEKVFEIGQNLSVDVNEATELTQMCPNLAEIKSEKVESRMAQLIDISCRFLEGLFQNVSHCKDFLRFNGLQLLLNFYTLKSIPYDFGTSPSSAPLSYIIRVIIEVNLQETAGLIGEGIQNFISNISSFLNHTGNESHIFPYLSVTELQKTSEGSKLYHSLVGLKCYIRLLTDLFCTHALSHSKAINAIIATFTSPAGSRIIDMLGNLANTCALETLYLKDQIPDNWKIKSEINAEEFSKLSPTDKAASKNLEFFMFLLEEIPQDLLGVFKGIIKSICTRKISDTANRNSIQKIIDEISNLLLKNLQPSHLRSKDKEIAYYNMILPETKGLLVDEKTSPFLLTAQLVSFEKKGGLDILFSLLHNSLKFSSDASNRNTSLETILSILSMCTNHKMLHDSPHTAIMVGRTKEKKSKEYFSAHTFLIHMRRKILKEILEIWENDAFVKLPKSCIQLIVQTIIQILSEEGEVPSEASSIFSASASGPFSIGQLAETFFGRQLNHAPIVPDENKIALLVDMGFPRGAAEIALTRCGNNVARAADYLINHPEVVSMAQTPTNTNSATNTTPANNNTSPSVPEPIPPTTNPDQQAQEEISTLNQTADIAATVTQPINDIIQNAQNADAQNTVADDNVSENDEENTTALDMEKEELNKIRDDTKSKIQLRCIEVLVQVENSHIYLLKELICLIAKDNMSYVATVLGRKILDAKQNFVLNPDNEEVNNQLATYFRFVTLVSSESSYQMDVLNFTDIDILEFLSLVKDCDGPKSWFTPLFLFMELKISVVDEPSEKTENEQESKQTFKLEEREILLRELIRILNFEAADSDLVHSVLRLLVRLTRDSGISQLFVNSDGILMMLNFKYFATFSAYQPLVLMILRHCLESKDVLASLMETEVSTWLKSPRPRSMDLQTFIKGSSHIICRDPDLFVEVCAKICELYQYDPDSRHHLISIKPSEDADVNIETVAKGDSTPKASEIEQVFSEERLSNYTGKIVNYLASEIMSLRPVHNFNVADESNVQLHLRRCYLLQCLSELVVCYFDTKVDFIHATQKKSVKQTPKSSSKNEFLTYLLGDLLHPDNTLISGAKTEKFKNSHQVTESMWASSLVTGLCFYKGKLDEKRASELKSIRTIVLDAVYRTIRDTFNSVNMITEVRFGKLINLCDLCYRILSVKSNGTIGNINQTTPLSEPTIQIVQLMIEKGFVNLFTNILADLDIHHPISQRVVESVLKPLEVFSKAAITLGKSEVVVGVKGKKTGTPFNTNVNPFDSIFHEIEDEEMEEETELSSLYRNSALGMLDPASEEEDSDSDDEHSDLFEEFSEDEDMEEISEEDGESSTEDEMEIVVPQPFQGNQEVTSSEDEQGQMESEELNAEEANHWPTDDVSEEEMEEEESDHEGDADENQEAMVDEGHDIDEDEYDEDDMEDLDHTMDVFIDDQIEDVFDRPAIIGNAPRRMQELFTREIEMNHGVIDIRAVGPFLRNQLDMTDGTIYNRNLPGRSQNLMDMSHPFLIDAQNNANQNSTRRANSRTAGILGDLDHSDGGSILPGDLMEQIFSRTRMIDASTQRLVVTTGSQNVNTEPQSTEIEPFSSPLKEQVQNVHAFLMLYTDDRWKQEAKLLYGNSANSKAARISSAILEQLVPPAMEKRKIFEEEKRKFELEKLQKEEEEKAKKEKELKEQQAQVEAETEALDTSEDRQEDVEMESSASVPEERVFVTIDGNPIDITGTGIDPTFLEALPDDLRQEVINQHMREQGNLRPNSAPENTEINPEFLNALPFAIREEVLRQERLENHQRQTITPVQSSVTPMRSNIPIPSAVLSNNQATPKSKSVHSKESAQLLDQPGLASLLRLIFVPEPLGKDYLDRLLSNLCENTKTRTELLGLLFSVLIHGSNDLASVDKEFAQLTLKSRSNLPYATKEKKINSLSDHDISDKIPNLVAQRCLESLTRLVTSSPSVGKYFLTEIDNPLSSKTPKSSKKSKGKEKAYHPLSCYPVVLLLNLLEKSSFLQNGIVLEQLMHLLSNVLRPLAHLARKKYGNDADDKEKDSLKTPTKDKKDKADVKLPKIPENSVKCVVNVLKGAVCSSKTFQHTLSVIQHLCTYPEHLKIITKAILESAQVLGNVIVDDMEFLIQKLRNTPNIAGTMVDKTALEPFISATASQAKLLRILKSIDFMFSKNQEKTTAVGANSEMAALKLHYEELKFTKLWSALGDCMDIVEDNENLIHVATIILPLIESFMVISKPSVSLTKEKPLTTTISLPNVLLKQHSEISEIEQDSFFTFAEAHKKILNTMVRNNPSLMNGSFSLLVQNPKVLQFDNKRTYFTQQLHKNAAARVSHGSIQINVRRQYVFEESYQQLQGKSGDAIKYGKLNVRFRDEEGVDAGGVTREWFSALALQMFNPDYALFRPSAADKVTYQPNRTSGINPDHLFYFKFVGRIIGKAIYDGRLLDAYFTRSFYKCIINSPVDHRDMEAIDPEFYKSLDWMLNNDITDVLDLTFSLEVDDFGKQKIIDLKENGHNISVTEANKTEYVRLVTEQKLVLAIKDQIQAFLNGFHEIIPRDLIKIFNEQELELLISGLPDIDIDDWKNNTEYENYTSTSPQIQWFWRAVRSFSQEERAKLIQFATGTSKVPLGGFAQLQGSTGIQKFQIHREFSSNSRLPSAHTW
ncbi:hypothetical protein HDV06_004367 [Boothiomyces sp. JEL0866]|nr:hypothetical protein HDV06_004367 [Boothiomyces sp. JEL0866]